MKSKLPGKNTSIVEISSISPFGVWIYCGDHEYYLNHEDFPWFKDAKVRDVMNVKALSQDHLYWPDLDVDLHLSTIKNPAAYPMISKNS